MTLRYAAMGESFGHLVSRVNHSECQEGSMDQSAAEILREYGPFPDADRVNGVTFDGQQVWFASGDKLNAFDPVSGNAVRSIDVAAHAGTAFDGQHLFQIAEDRILKIDPETGPCPHYDPRTRRQQ